MQTFDDLIFNDRKDWFGGRRATLAFANGYTISVIDGPNAYCGPGSYEVAVMHDGRCVYDTPITNDVLGYQTAADVSALMARIAALPARIPA